MSWVAAAVVGGSVIGGVLQSGAADEATDAQRDGTRDSIGEQRRQFDLTRTDYAPYREAGARALGQLERENAIDGSDLVREVEGDRGFQFGMRQGQLALDRKAAAGGGRVSGAALKEAARYGSDYASTGYGAAYQRRNDRLNRWAALAGIGQTATGGSAAAGQYSANAISSIISNQGDASAAGSLAKGNIWANTTNQIGAAAQKWASNQSAPYGRDQFGTAFTNEDIYYN